MSPDAPSPLDRHAALPDDGVDGAPAAAWWPSGSRGRPETRARPLEGTTENAAVCQSLLANLQSRGLRNDRSLLVILDGAQALHKATRAVFGEAALIQRCQVHKLRNILDHLPERQRPWVQAIVRRAYQATDVKTATRLLTDLAKRLDDEYPSAAGPSAGDSMRP